jgi:hypothetical protein
MKRRTHRKGTRRNRSTMSGGKRGTMRSCKRSTMRGGYVLTGSDINDTSMNAPSKLNMLQGEQFSSQHANQHGGSANVGYTGVLPQDMRAAARVNQAGGVAPVGDTGVMDVNRVEARVGPIDNAFQEIAGMRDQAGGRRRRSSRKSRKSRKSRSGKKSRSNMRRYMYGGTASVSDPTMMLPVGMEKEAVMGMNPEWKLAENPTSFNPIR